MLEESQIILKLSLAKADTDNMGIDFKKGWRRRTREYLAAAFGGKCTICGYDRCLAALDYHHVEPKDKQLSTAMRNGYAWKRIVQEARKCTILCCRCHRELHAGVIELPKVCAQFHEDYIDLPVLRQREFDECPVCGAEKYIKQKHCSRECSRISQQKFEIDRDVLSRLINEKPYEEIGQIYNVSGNAVKKRCRLLGIPLQKRRGYWSRKRKKVLDVTKEQLSDLLRDHSVTAIAKIFHTTTEVVKRHINHFQLEVPPINWHRRAAKIRWRV